jgi:expansin (peptidoglycan-binding protein)
MTIGAVMAPQVAMAHNDTDSVYAYVVWNRWDDAMNIYATYEAIGMPGGSGGEPPTTAKVILRGVNLRKVNLGTQ